jgi:hypothetical protein
MHKSATKCNETIGKWCKNKHGASKIIDTLETYQRHQHPINSFARNPTLLACLTKEDAKITKFGGMQGRGISPPMCEHKYHDTAKRHAWAQVTFGLMM